MYIIKIEGDIDENMLNSVYEQMKEWAETHSKEDIAVQIDSKGGYIDIAQYIGDLIYLAKEEKGVNIVTFNSGDVMSAASLIYLMGDARLFDPSKGEFLIHRPVSVDVEGHTEDLLDAAVANNAVEESLIEYYQEFNGKERNEIFNRMSKEEPMNIDELKEYGFVTEIV